MGWWWLRLCGAAIFFFLAPIFAAQAGADTTPFPNPPSKKGLQVQMVDDALSLGVHHAALNVNLAQLLELSTNETSLALGDRTFYFRQSYVDHLDSQIQPLSRAGVVVSLILLYYRSGQEQLDQLMLHPQYDPACPNHLSAFNLTNPESTAAFRACLEFLARRYSSSDSTRGRVWNYILGNEVNSHWFWSNMGRTTMEQFADEYHRALRVAHQAIRRYSAHARLYVSLEHHWNIRYPGGTADQTFAARPFLEYLAKKSRAEGDFDWHVAFHPYPENLFEPRTWNDKSATFADDTPRITFKNLEMLPRFLRRAELLLQGQPRRIILSEQGFHSPEGPDGEKIQAAAYCFAWTKSTSIPEIDSFILHRHVDHAHEGGLNLGLWARAKAAGHPAQPDRKKLIYEVFKNADTAHRDAAFAFALPVIGLTNWHQLQTSR